jgi:hypothetical protein
MLMTVLYAGIHGSMRRRFSPKNMALCNLATTNGDGMASMLRQFPEMQGHL